MRRKDRPPGAMQNIPNDLFGSVIYKYLTSDKFRSLASDTQRNWHRTLMLAAYPDSLGGVPVDAIRPSLVQAFLDGLADRPGTQENAKTVLRALERWAIVRDLLPREITKGTEVVGSNGGHVPWTDEQVAFAEQNAAIHLSRAVTLAANTGQRGSDIVRMRWTDIEIVGGRPGINVKQKKTGLELWVPFTDQLIRIMDSWERRPGFILLKRDGQPFKDRGHLTMAWVRERRRPELEPLRDLHLHGLRATAIVRLQRLGASIREITSLVGLSQAMVENYCRLADQKQNALAAFDRLNQSRQSANILKFKA